MSLALKFTSLAVRTFSKPIANYIKRQAREHPGFRKTCVAFAQSLHRVDMRWRIGLLQDSAALEKQAARDAARKEAERKKAEIVTVKTEAQTKADEAAEKAAEKAEQEQIEKDKHPPKPKIKPLSETKAIESGANFISETFLFSVAAGLILFESWRSGRKAKNQRDKVAEQLNDLEEENKAARQALIELEREILRLRAKDKSVNGHDAPKRRILPEEVYELVKGDTEDIPVDDSQGWWKGMTLVFTREEPADKEAQQAIKENLPGPAEKMLRQADKALEEKRRLRDAEEVRLGDSNSPKRPAKQ